jgi:hypothetical protein
MVVRIRDADAEHDATKQFCAIGLRVSAARLQKIDQFEIARIVIAIPALQECHGADECEASATGGAVKSA